MGFSRFLWLMLSFVVGRMISSTSTQQVASSLINIPLELVKKILLFALAGVMIMVLMSASIVMILVDLALRANEGLGFAPTNITFFGLGLFVVCAIGLFAVTRNATVAKPALREKHEDQYANENPLVVAVAKLVTDFVETRQSERQYTEQVRRQNFEQGFYRQNQDADRRPEWNPEAANSTTPHA